MASPGMFAPELNPETAEQIENKPTSQIQYQRPNPTIRFNQP
jgi:hypothetical protein